MYLLYYTHAHSVGTFPWNFKTTTIIERVTNFSSSAHSRASSHPSRKLVVRSVQ